MEAVNHSPKTASGVELPAVAPVAIARTVAGTAEATTGNKTAIDFKRTVKCGYYNSKEKKANEKDYLNKKELCILVGHFLCLYISFSFVTEYSHLRSRGNNSGRRLI